MTRRVFLILLAAVLTLSVGLVACGGIGEQEEEEQGPETYDLSISSTEGGSVTTPGEGTFTYDQVTVVNLEAEAEEGYRFVEWTGDVSTVGNVNDATTIITTDNDYVITANFVYGPAIPPRNPGSFVQMTVGIVPSGGNTTGDIESLDPAWVYDGASAEQIQYIYETLVFYDGEKIDEFVPVLATEWEFDSENISYRFKIREGVKFQEGGDLTAEDVEYSFERAMVQDRSGGPIWTLFQPLLGVGSSHEVTFADIDGAVEVDGDWVVFGLADSAWRLPFLQILCFPWASIVDKEWCVSQGDWNGTEGTWEDHNRPDIGDSYLYNHTNGTGPWQLEEWDPGVQVKLVRNDEYWREPAAFETVTTQFVTDWTTRKEALLAGDADFVDTYRYTGAAHYLLEGIEELDKIEDLNVYQDLPELIADAFHFNMAIAEDSIYIGSGQLDGEGIPTDFFTDMDVRKGFNYAFDWDTYIESGLSGLGEQRGSPIIEGLPFYNPDASMYSLDLTKAEEHLRAAWDGEVWESGINFTIVSHHPSPRRKAACEILAGNLFAINPKFQVNIETMDFWTVTVPDIFDRVLPMWMVGFIADYPHPDNFVVPYMASYGGIAWFQDYGDPELDQLIEDAFNEIDPAVQKDLYYEIQERYYEDAPSIMLGQRFSARYFTKYIEGFYFNPFILGLAGPLYYMSKSES